MSETKLCGTLTIPDMNINSINSPVIIKDKIFAIEISLIKAVVSILILLAVGLFRSDNNFEVLKNCINEKRAKSITGKSTTIKVPLIIKPPKDI